MKKPKKNNQTPTKPKKGKPAVAKTIAKKEKGKRGRAKSKSNYYFTQVHEDAIAEYVRSKDSQFRNKIYTDVIRPVFGEIVDKIVFTYKFTTIPNIDSLRDECKVWLTTVLDKFNPDKGHKAFSYFSVITKNWFIHKTKAAQKQAQREVMIDSIPKAIEQKYLSYDAEERFIETQGREQFLEGLKEDMEYWEDDLNAASGSSKTLDADKKVLKAVAILLESADEIEIFNKKGVYLYLREITGLNTKQIAQGLKNIKPLYGSFREFWKDEEIGKA